MKLTTLCLALSMTVAAAVASIACTSAVELDADGKKADSDGKANGEGESAKANGSGGDATKVVTTKTGIPCDVDAILKKNCQTCHGAEPISGANTALVTWDDMMKPGPGVEAAKKVWELVKARIHDDARPMPAAPAPRIAGKDLEVMDKWFADGAKADEATCTGNAPADSVKPLSCKADTILKASEKFTMAADTPLDSYQCFGVDVNVPAKRHVTGLAPNVDNAKIVHHILLFQTDKAEPTKPFACEAFGSAAWKLIAGWAPGGNNLELPPEAGFPQEKGTTHWVLQIHYNNAAKTAGAQDNSGYSLCTTDKLRPNDAGVVAFGSTKFNLPPRATSTVKCDYTLNAKYNGVKMFNASPHMHTRGTAMATEKLAGGEGAPTPVFEQKNFSFEAQSNYPINVSVQEGDVMRTRCTYKNPGDTTIVFGEGTGDEMCFNFIGYYPAIPDRTPLGIPLQTWVTPSALAKCTME